MEMFKTLARWLAEDDARPEQGPADQPAESEYDILTPMPKQAKPAAAQPSSSQFKPSDPGYGKMSDLMDPNDNINDDDDDGPDREAEREYARLQATWDEFVTKDNIKRLVPANIINSAELLAKLKLFKDAMAQGPKGLAKAAKVWAEMSALLRELARAKAEGAVQGAARLRMPRGSNRSRKPVAMRAFVVGSG